MKKAIALGILLAAAGGACGYLGEIVASYRTPPGNVYALAVGDRYLYAYSTGPFYLYRLERWTGKIVSSYEPAVSGTIRGLAFERGQYLWMHNQGLAPVWLHRCDEATGSIYSSMPIITQYCLDFDFETTRAEPGRIKTILMGVVIGIYGNHVLRYTPTGSFIDSFKPETTPWSDVTWDYGNAFIWIPRSGQHPYYYAYDTRGSLITSFPPITAVHVPYVSDYYGEYLWVDSRTITDPHILIIHCPVLYPAVTPASVGRVKALFR